MRSVSANDYAARTTRIEHHYHAHYPRYDYYRSQPYVYIGGGYSSLFWYAMLDWSVERRAIWLYHNQNVIDRQLYNQQLQNAELRAKIAALESQGVQRDSSYVDSEFKSNPDLMYDDSFVAAAYNAQAQDSGGVSAGTFFKWFFIIVAYVVGACVLIWLCFIKQWR